MRLSLGLTTPDIAVRQPAAGWSPLALGASLLAWWDAEDVNSLALAGSDVSSWTDRKGGLVCSQTVVNWKPQYTPSGFNGRPGIVFNGDDDHLTLASVGLPTGGAACEIWTLADQAATTDMVARNVFSYGGTTTGLGVRSIRRVRTAGQNRAAGQVGDASGTVVVGSAATDNFTGRHITRLAIGASSTVLSVDGVAGTPVTLTPSTGAVRTRIGADVASTASSLFQGTISAILVTASLGTGDAAALLNHLKARGGVP